MSRKPRRAPIWTAIGLCGILAFATNRAAHALTAPTAVQISPDGLICHDFPDVLVTNQNVAAYGVWTGYDYFSTDQDDLYVAALNNTTWTTGSPQGIIGDLFCPRLGFAGGSDLWMLWSQQVAGNWDLYASPLPTTSVTRLTTDPGSDTNLATASDSSRNRFFAVWQGFRNGKSAIFLLPYMNGAWGTVKTVSQRDSNEWYPKAVVDSLGRVWIAWDSYRNGNYDVFLRSYLPDSGDGQFGQEIQVTANPKFEANATVACDADNRVWMAWDTGTANWGKDQGKLVAEGRLTQYPGERFITGRRIAVGVYDGAAVRTTLIPIDSLYPTNFDNTFSPIVTVDQRDRFWVFYARQVLNGGSKGWQYVMTRYTDDGTTTPTWDTPKTIPTSLARLERKLAVARYANNRLLALWQVDGRTTGNIRRILPNGNKIYAGLVNVPAATNVDPILVDPPVDAPTTQTHPNEASDVTAIRNYRLEMNGKTYRIVRGDLHRHTDTSGDGNNDSSIEDSFRYMYDAASLDYMMPSDHHGTLLSSGIANWNFYPWHRTQKYDDIYFSAGITVPFQGYERSVVYPDGHRNIVFPARYPRGESVIPTSPTLIPTGTDQRWLWSQIKPLGGISIPHTIGDNMGTDWSYDLDYGAEKILELYQGCRYSFENYTTTPVYWPNIDQGAPGPSIRPDGFYFAMLSQRLGNGDFAKKLGIISSSDHTSTHLSYGCVYVEEDKVTRQGILDAMMARHTYGAMDNIIMDVRCGEAMMGDEIVFTKKYPTFNIRIYAAKPLNEVVVIKDNAIACPNLIVTSNTTQYISDWTDMDCAEGYHYYYVRARQNDGKVETDGSQIDGTIAWSSPIWLQRVIVPASWVRNWFRY